MSGKKETTTTQQATQDPWGPVQPLLKDLLGQLQPQIMNTGATANENLALDKLTGIAQKPNQYAGDMNGLLANLFKGGGIGETAPMVKDAYGMLSSRLDPTARGDFVDPTSNPYLQKIVGRTQDDIRNQTAQQFAGAGRSFSGAHLNALGTGIGKATQDLYYNDYNAERARQSDAIKTMFGGANTAAGTLENIAGGKLGAQLQAPGLLNQVSGLETQPWGKLLEVEALRRGLPLQNMGMLASLLFPMAQLGKQTQGTGTQTTTGDPWENIFKGVGMGSKLLFGI